MNEPRRGEVWMVDLGMAAKVRPCLVISIAIREYLEAAVKISKGAKVREVEVPVESCRSFSSRIPLRTAFESMSVRLIFLPTGPSLPFIPQGLP